MLRRRKRAAQTGMAEKMRLENPSLAGKDISTPIVTNALTHGLSIAADLFVNEGDTPLLPDKYWEITISFSVSGARHPLRRTRFFSRMGVLMRRGCPSR